MIIKYDDLGHSVIRIPDCSYFEFQSRYDEGLFLILPDREIRMYDMFREGPLPCERVYDLYNEIVDVIADMLTDENLTVIDVDAIENTLMNKHKEEWISRGYFTEEIWCR